jgi:hypothetical protein
MFIGVPACVRRQAHEAGSTVTPPGHGKYLGGIMMLGLLGFLMVVTFYLAKRLSDEKTENTALRDRITSLKRQLARQRRTPVGA